MKNRKRLVTIIIIAVCLVCAGLAIFLIKRKPNKKIDKEFMIKTENNFDYQNNFGCSGYAAAYALRSMGENAEGMDIYNKIETKNSDGTVTPANLTKSIKGLGYKAELKIGTIEELKMAVEKGIPVIVLVKVTPDSSYLHYIPVVGYDEDNIYASDSLKYAITGEKDYYNRVISLSDFEKMWDTGTFKNVFIKISK